MATPPQGPHPRLPRGYTRLPHSPTTGLPLQTAGYPSPSRDRDGLHTVAQPQRFQRATRTDRRGGTGTPLAGDGDSEHLPSRMRARLARNRARTAAVRGRGARRMQSSSDLRGMQEMKTCTRCKVAKERGEFGRHKKAGDGLQPRCRPCNKASVAEWRAKNPEHTRAYGASQMRKLRAANPKRYREINRQANARFREAHGQVYRIRKAGVPHEDYSRAETFARYSRTCAYCSDPAEHIDHILPISKGGADAPHNLLPACAPCNLSKGAKTLAEWAATF